MEYVNRRRHLSVFFLKLSDKPIAIHVGLTTQVVNVVARGECRGRQAAESDQPHEGRFRDHRDYLVQKMKKFDAERRVPASADLAQVRRGTIRR